MSEKSIRLRIDGRGKFEGVSKDLEADMIVAYVMNFVDDTVETDIAFMGWHELGGEEMARQLGKISARMIGRSFGNEGGPKCWEAFERGWKSEMSNIAREHVKDLLAKFGDMLDSMDKREEEDED